jgi:hypothetical protein
MAIPLGRPLPSASCDRPERRREGPPGSPGISGVPAAPTWSCSRWGFPCHRRCRRRGALLPHRFTLAAHPCYRNGLAVYFLWHFPWGRPRRVLPGTVPPWSPDFPPSADRGERPSDRLALSDLGIGRLVSKARVGTARGIATTSGRRRRLSRTDEQMEAGHVHKMRILLVGGRTGGYYGDLPDCPAVPPPRSVAYRIGYEGCAPDHTGFSTADNRGSRTDTVPQASPPLQTMSRPSIDL